MSQVIDTPSPVAPDSLWTVRDFAEFLKVSRNWVYTRVAQGQLPHVRFGAMVRFVPDRIREFIQGTASAQLSASSDASHNGKR